MRFGFFVVLLALLFPASQAAHFAVSPGESIQEAIDAAEDGDLVEVESGIYYELVSKLLIRPLIMNRSLHVI